MSYGTRQFKNVYEVYCTEREPDTPIKHNRNYKTKGIACVLCEVYSCIKDTDHFSLLDHSYENK